jgi:hypothetical protein
MRRTKQKRLKARYRLAFGHLKPGAVGWLGFRQFRRSVVRAENALPTSTRLSQPDRWMNKSTKRTREAKVWSDWVLKKILLFKCTADGVRSMRQAPKEV